MCLEKYGFRYFLHFTSVCANMNYYLTKRESDYNLLNKIISLGNPLIIKMESKLKSSH